MSDIMEPTTDVAVVSPTLVPAVVFAPGGVDDILAKIERDARAMKVDISTPVGRKACASLAYKVARSKTALDAMGKGLTDEWRARTDAVNADRRKVREKLDALADEIRRPLTEWEEADKRRIAEHEAAILAIFESPEFFAHSSSEELRARLAHLEATPPRDWQEFAQRAADALMVEISKTRTGLAAAEKREAEAADLARLRAEEEERQRQEAARLQAEREARIATEAAARAQREAEEKGERERVQAERRAQEEARTAAAAAEAERQRVEQARQEAEERAAREAERARQAEAARAAAEERARQEAQEAAARAERARAAAEERARRDQEAAVEAERQRAAQAKADEEAAAAQRAANRAHKARINGEARAALVTTLGLSEVTATDVIRAIAGGAVPHVSIRY